MWQVTNDDQEFLFHLRIDGSGTWVVYELISYDPITWDDIFRVRTDGTGWEAITTWGATGHASRLPDISADGTKIVYHSTADPLGTNPNAQALHQKNTVFDVAQRTKSGGLSQLCR